MIIILAASAVDGKKFAESKKLEEKTYRVVTPYTINSIRGITAKKLYVHGSPQLTQEQWMTVQECFFQSGKSFKVTPIGDINVR